ncbi:hypothetical protein ATO12_18005 [Aquimarina atlantica]|uniref:IPT/TIG domain-containing protein n=1 Tax=Aquimarina atlantica TaxID=1317122 RepID=A0A023BUZ3_9FLAO|nr:IPT/TIG domain-containing protein [Aquimarina atlantica]EZH73826.1 hypothetical protein ATO12_18005 [Aquimarina atlantica]
MRKFLSLLTILTIVFSCSSDDSTEPQQNEFPTNIAIASQTTAGVGDILTINGNGFLTSETYIVTFTDNEIAKIIEINSNYLKLEVPEKAISGDITLTHNNKTEIIGSILINTTSNVYAYKRNYSDPNNYIKQIIKIDKQTGSETIVTDLDINSTYYESLVFDNSEKNILGIVENSILSVNTETGQSTTINLENSSGIDYQEIVLDDNGNLYAYKRNYADPNNYIKQIVKIDKQTGGETIVADLNINSTYYESLVFDSSEKNILGIVENSILSVNTETGQSTIINLENSSGIDYQEIVLDDNGNLYAYKRNYTDPNNYIKQIIKIDKQTGGETIVADLNISSTYYEDLIFDSSEKNILGIVENSILSVNIETGESITINLENSNDVDYQELVVMN